MFIRTSCERCELVSGWTGAPPVARMASCRPVVGTASVTVGAQSAPIVPLCSTCMGAIWGGVGGYQHGTCMHICHGSSEGLCNYKCLFVVACMVVF